MGIAVALIAGVIGRNLAYGEARVTPGCSLVASLIALARRFDRMPVIPGSGLVLLSGIGSAWLERLPLLGFLEGAQSNWLLVSNVLYLAIVGVVGLIRPPPAGCRH